MAARERRSVAVAERYRGAGRARKGRILDELCVVTGWHRKHAVRALRFRAYGGNEQTLLALLGILSISFSAIFVRLAAVSPVSCL